MSELNIVENEKDETQATLTAKDVEMIVNGMLNATGRVAPRAAGNIANKTEHYGLPLPVSNETMAYQDFINEPNGIIDGALYSLQQAIDNLSTTITQLGNSVTALDTKVSGIQTTLTQADLPGMKTEISSLDSRVETLEDDVMSFIAPTPIPRTRGGSPRLPLVKAGGIVFCNEGIVVNISDVPGATIPVNTVIHGYGNLTSDVVLNYNANAFELGTVSGNLLNLPENNEYYLANYIQNLAWKDNFFQSGPVNLVAIYNGVNTIFYALLGSDRTTVCNFQPWTVAIGQY